ncbi:CCA tRNA nucleotidyltransferase [bacterium]|nr:CCA tRNA nucleotidyltransferase [bacterium]
MKTKLRKNAEWIVRKLNENGFKAYFAGGCVRDMIMGIDPKDYDIATSAKPEEIKNIFKKTVMVGAQFGVAVVIKDGKNYDVATFRKDKGCTDGRHPNTVIYTDEKEDVKRRDFTINGLLFDPLEDSIIDYVGGKKDIADGIIRTIGNPFERFNEDKLRLMRAVRIAARFDFAIEINTYEALVGSAHDIKDISKERVRDEIVKILTESNAKRGIELLNKTGLLDIILPEVTAMKGVEQPPEKHPEGDVYTHTLIMLDLMENPSAEFALGVLLHDVGKPAVFEKTDKIRFKKHAEVGAQIALQLLERLRFSNKQIEHIVNLVRNHSTFKDVKKMKKSTLKRFLSTEKFEDYLELHRLDRLASGRNLNTWEYCKEMLNKTPEEDLKPKPLITGDDLTDLGFKPGPHYKDILRHIEDEQLEGRIESKSEAVNIIKKEFGHLSSLYK